MHQYGDFAIERPIIYAGEANFFIASSVVHGLAYCAFISFKFAKRDPAVREPTASSTSIVVNPCDMLATQSCSSVL